MRVARVESPRRATPSEFRVPPRTRPGGAPGRTQRRASPMPFFGFFDPTFVLAIPALIFAFWAQSRVQGTYQKYSQVRAANGLTGRQMAEAIMRRNGISDVA